MLFFLFHEQSFRAIFFIVNHREELMLFISTTKKLQHITLGGKDNL